MHETIGTKRLGLLAALLLFISSGFLFSCSDDDTSNVSDGDTDAVEEESTENDLDAEAEEQEPFSAYACLIDTTCTRRMVAAHRGDHHDAPENSLASLRDAAEHGADFVEVDVRETADDVLVLMHDSDVDRTTDGTGYVNEMTWDEIQQLTLSDADATDPETQKVPQFSEILALAKELGIMLYIDQKTGRWDLVLETIQAGPYYEQSLVRDDFSIVSQMAAQDDQLLVMPPFSDAEELESAQEEVPTLTIVELSKVGADADFCTQAGTLGLKVQQDVMAGGDILGMSGDYSGWKNYVDAGVLLLQTDIPRLLIPAIEKFNETGVFDETGPADESLSGE